MMTHKIKYKVVIADDEPEAREGLQDLIGKDPSLVLCALCSNGVETIDAVMDHHPDLVFLDIQMPGVDGFEVIHSIPGEKLPAVVFVTAYDNYAIRAFEVNAVDYLLKPFTDERFNEALERAKMHIGRKTVEREMQTLGQMAARYIRENKSSDQVIFTRSEHKLSKQERLIFKSDGRVYFLPYMEVSRIEAFDYYLKIFTGKHFHLVRDSMKHMAEALPFDLFIRIHKSHIVNKSHIRNIEPAGNNEYQIELREGVRIKSGRSYKSGIKALIGAA